VCVEWRDAANARDKIDVSASLHLTVVVKMEFRRPPPEPTVSELDEVLGICSAAALPTGNHSSAACDPMSYSGREEGSALNIFVPSMLARDPH
jgi:hypothetical protein